MSTPSWYNLKNLDYKVYEVLDEIVRYSITSDVSTEPWTGSLRPRAVSNELSDVHASIQSFQGRAEKEGNPVLAVTRSYGIPGSFIHKTFDIWITGNFAHNCWNLLGATIHELAHAYVGSAAQHGQKWIDLYTDSLEEAAGIFTASTGVFKEVESTRGGKYG